MANQYFDLRLGYLVETPGLDDPLTEWEVKAGDGEEVVLQFGRSDETTGPTSIATAPSWTAENLDGTATIHIGMKEAGDYYDGDLLAGSSSFTHDAGNKTYTFELDLATTEINTALSRDDADDTNDTATLTAQYEVTFKSPSTAKPRSSVKPVTVTIYHDVLSTLEATPASAASPDLYSLKADTIVFHAEFSSLTGGTSSDFDSLATTSLSAGEAHAFFDDDNSSAFRVYELAAGTDAEDSPDVIRPDDYAASTNEKVWHLRNPATTASSILYQYLIETGTGNGTVSFDEYAPSALTVNKLFGVAMGSPTSNPSIRLRKNGTLVGSETSLGTSASSGTAQYGSTTDSISYAAGDRIQIELVDDGESGGTTSVNIRVTIQGAIA